MNGILWEELYFAKKHTIYLYKYISFFKSVKKFFDLTSILLTSSGFITWLANRGAIWVGISAALSIGTKVLEVLPDKFIANDEYLEDVAELRDKWCKYLSEIESLWISYRSGILDEKQASERFITVSKRKTEIDKSETRMKIWIIYMVNRQSDSETTDYMSRYHN